MSNFSVSVVIKALDKATGPIRKVTQALEQLGRVESIKRINASLQNIRTSFSNVANEASLLTQRLGGLAVAGVGLFAALTKPASEMENLRFRLDQLYGSASKGGQVFKWIQDFGQNSPYNFQTIADSLLSFKGQGFDNLKEFQNIMNYLAVYVPDNFRAQNAIIQLSQAWGKTKLQMADIRPLIEAGVPVWRLLEKVTGKNTAQLMKMSEAGTINRDIMMKMFKLMGVESAGAGGKIFDLWSTKLSNLGDIWFAFSYRLMTTKVDNLPLFGQLKKDVQTLSDFLRNGLTDTKIKQIAKELSEVYSFAKSLLFDAIIPIGKQAISAFKGFSNAVGGVQNAMKILLGLMAMPLIASIVSATVSFAGFAFTAISTLIQLSAYIGPVIWVLKLIGVIVGGLVAPFAGWIAIIGVVIAAVWLLASNWDKLKQTVSSFVSFAITQFKQWIGFIESFKKPWSDLTNTLQEFWANWGIHIKNAISQFSPLFSIVESFLNILKSAQGFSIQTPKLPNLKPVNAPKPGAPVKTGGSSKLTAMATQKNALEVAMHVSYEKAPKIQSIKAKGPAQVAFSMNTGPVYG